MNTTLCSRAASFSASPPPVWPAEFPPACGRSPVRVLHALDTWALSHVGSIAPGVALCRAHFLAPHLDGVEFMLKGGQMGPLDLFERLLAGY